MPPLELWGGVECTVNRVRDAFHDQLRASGHDHRVDDLNLLPALGIERVRYPILWERTSPHAAGDYDWRWADERLARLRELGMDPIVGLVHHGSGPRYTHLLDERFPELLAKYAAAVAARYSWVERYTPVNEPLTTARFSGLYGLWHPHRSDDRSFIRVLLNQSRATVLAMQAIRKINPAAQLIQTDDLGYTTCTPALAYQAEFDNERRWLAWDLLCGRVGRTHPLWEYLRKAGASERELDWFGLNACPPEMIGLNHYVTSDRHLDDRVELYPPQTVGGNGKHRYADVEAVRALPQGAPGIAAALDQAWRRYRLPIAITEAHLGCTREEQLRWFAEFWRTAEQARAEGVDIRAVTVWSLLGSFDWNSLLTRFAGHYEPGAFDIRGPAPRATALARLVRELATGAQCEDRAILDEPGWWRRSTRLFPKVAATQGDVAPTRKRGRHTLLITGGTGTLGYAFARICEQRALNARICTRAELDICDAQSIERALEETKPWAVINTAGYVRVDEAERERERCFLENGTGAALLARACAARGTPLVTFSSDLVFDGERTSPYVETHAVRPLNVYGLSKARAERDVMAAHPQALVIRTSAFFGPWDEHNFVTNALRALRSGAEFTALEDVIVSPTYVPDLVHSALDLLLDRERGVWHLANQGALSWLDLARCAAHLAGISSARLVRVSWRAAGLAAVRPAFSALTSERGIFLPTTDDALARYVAA
jgi:dTDP-4-dehydrorhamnose reductase